MTRFERERGQQDLGEGQRTGHDFEYLLHTWTRTVKLPALVSNSVSKIDGGGIARAGHDVGVMHVASRSQVATAADATVVHAIEVSVCEYIFS
jgi:hypothetical protein